MRPKTPAIPVALTIKQAAERLQAHPNSVYVWAHRGIIPARKIGGVWRIDRAALDRFLAGEAKREDPRGMLDTLRC